MSANKLEESKKTGPHHLLAQLAGRWEGPTRTYFEPGKLADESAWKASFSGELDGRVLALEYEGSFGGKPLQGRAMIAHHLDAERFQVAWMDTFHTGTALFFSEGSGRANGFSVLTHYEAGGQRWGWRTEYELVGPDELAIRHFNITPEGAEALGVETRLARRP